MNSKNILAIVVGLAAFVTLVFSLVLHGLVENKEFASCVAVGGIFFWIAVYLSANYLLTDVASRSFPVFLKSFFAAFSIMGLLASVMLGISISIGVLNFYSLALLVVFINPILSLSVGFLLGANPDLVKDWKHNSAY